MSAKILFSGDLRIDGKYQSGISDFFQLFEGYDLYVLNFETAVRMDDGGAVAQKSVPLVSSMQDLTRMLALVEPSRLLLNVANNHTLDAGDEDLRRAVDWLREKGVWVLEHGQWIDMNLNGSSLCFHAFDYLRDPIGTKLDFAECRNPVVSLAHWGEEYVFAPSPAQKSHAAGLLASGVDLVVGCHPHVMQGWCSGEDGSVYYSLGNSVFGVDGAPGSSRLGSVLECVFSDRIESEQLMPLRIQGSGHIRLLNKGESAEYGEFAKSLCDNMLLSPIEWHAQASGPFFRNHMASWCSRIKKYGWIELLKMGKAFVSREYACMLCGLMINMVTRSGRRSPDRKLADFCLQAENAG